MSDFLDAVRREYERLIGTPLAELTHVLSWLPGRFASDGEGFWELRTIAAWNAAVREPPFADYSPGRDLAPLELQQWAADVIGYPVALEPDVQDLASLGGSDLTTEPLFWIRRMA